MAHTTVEKVAEVLNLTPRRVQQLHDEGMPREGRGQYNILTCVMWYVRYLQRKLDERGPASTAESADIATERTRLVSAQANKQEMENLLRAGALVPVSDIKRTWANHVSSVKKRLLSIPSKLGPQLVNTASTLVVASSIKNEIESALTELGAGKHAQSGTNSAGDYGDVFPATAVDRKSVGRRKPKAVKRVRRRARAMENGAS